LRDFKQTQELSTRNQSCRYICRNIDPI